MTRHENLLLVRMLRYQGQLAKEHLQVVLKLAESCENYDAMLAQLYSHEFVTQEWIQGAQRYLRSKVRSRIHEGETLSRLDRSFGQIALASKLIHLDQLEAALLEQQRLQGKNLHFRLGEVLVKLKAMTPAEVREVLAQQGVRLFECGQCELVFEASAELQDPHCSDCHGELSAPKYLELVRSDRYCSA